MYEYTSSMKSILYHTTYLSVFLNCMIYVGEFIFLMMVVKHFDAGYLRTLIIIVSWKRIDKSIHFPDFWYKVGLEVTFCARGSYEKCSIFQEEAEEITLAYCGVSDIAIPDIHSILGEYTITYGKSNLLISYHEPGMHPEITVVKSDSNRKRKKDDYCPSEWKWSEEIGDESHEQGSSKNQFRNLRCENNPMLSCFVEDLLFKSFICHKK